MLEGQIERIAYTKTEAAEMLGLCPRTIDNMIAEKELTARKIGRSVRIPAGALYTLIGYSPKTTNTVVRLAYTKAEAASALAISPRTVDNLIAAKQLASRKVRGRVLIPTDSLRSLMRSDHRTLQAAA
jgi:excisionase family DNA binding protein